MTNEEKVRVYRLLKPARLAFLRWRAGSRAGFTLIELMVVAVVLAILAAAIIPNLFGRIETAKRARAQSDVAALETALELFYLDMGRYPSTEEGLRILYFKPESEAEKWKGPYLKKPIFKDAWGNEYVYRSPGARSAQPFEVASYGKDGEEGGEDDNADIQSWVDTEQAE